jgi:hypothetical protein
MSTKLVSGTIYSVSRNPDSKSGAALLKVRVLDDADGVSLYSVTQSAKGDALPISLRQLAEAGLPADLLTVPLDGFVPLAESVLDQAVVIRVTDVMVPKKDAKGAIVGERPGYDAAFEPKSRTMATI